MSDFVLRRLEICGACEFLVDTECALCGCTVAEKVLNEEESCPASQPKWTALSKQVSQVINHPTAGCVPCRSRGNKK